MVEAGLTEMSALNTVGVPGPLSGSITSDRAESCNLLVFSACCTLAGSVVLTAAAWEGKATGRSRPASRRGRRDLIMCNKTLQARGEKNGARKGEGPGVKNIVRIMPQGAG
ncbi:hypothetical protein D3C80_1435200 [compost metagenome]